MLVKRFTNYADSILILELDNYFTK
jgi:hypothetical protein